jgi:GNAT superfamily N-acetyltransferase
VVPGETGPSGGPLLTDVLGVCTSWADGVCTVRPESGELVAISISDIVSGKPVPPRPSIRQRVSVRDAEAHALPLWADVERVALGEWELRSVARPPGRLLKRTNSCLAIGDPGMPVADAVAAVLEFYRARGREPMAQVELDSEHDAALTQLGWTPVPGGDSHFLTASVAHALRGTSDPGEVEIVEDLPRLRAELTIDGTEVGRVSAALNRDWLGVHGLVVEESHRRSGLGTALMAGVLEWGAEHGASTVWLHVETDNHPALTLYGGLGFRVHHSCRYLAPPTLA